MKRVQGEYRWSGIARSIEEVYHEILGWKRGADSMPGGREAAISEPGEPLPVARVRNWARHYLSL